MAALHLDTRLSVGFFFSSSNLHFFPCMQIGTIAENPNDLCKTSAHNLPRHAHYCSPASTARMNQNPPHGMGICFPHHPPIAAAPQLPVCECGVGILQQGPSPLLAEAPPQGAWTFPSLSPHSGNSRGIGEVSQTTSFAF
jgi:hypothetical protein